MNVRQKLVELLQNAKAAMKSENLSCDIARNMFVVDFMMANGVTVQDRTEPMTNADRIRAMSDEEITEFVCRNGINTLCDIICGGECNAIASFKKSGDEACKEIVMNWLEQPVKEEQ